MTPGTRPAQASSWALAIREALSRAGFRLIQAEPRHHAKGTWRPDFVAWASDQNGNLVPWVTVEVKSLNTPEDGLPALARARDEIGTVDHYVFNKGTWLRADTGLRSLHRVDAPEPPIHGGEGVLADPDLATSLMTASLWKAADRQRGMKPLGELPFFPAGIVDEGGIVTDFGEHIAVRKDALWQGWRNALVDFQRRLKHGGWISSQDTVTRAVSLLAGRHLSGTLLDPFCGAGSFLWEAIDRAQARGDRPSSVVGCEINPLAADIARSVAQLSPVPTEIILGDALHSDLLSASCVVSAPPFGVQVRETHELLDGSMSRQGDLVILDRILRLIDDGGRAVVHVSHAVTYRANYETYRHFLATHFRVGAIIGLPSGAVPETQIRSILMVVDKAAPSETFVANLGEDWEAQLSEGGGAIEAAIAHLDGARR